MATYSKVLQDHAGAINGLPSATRDIVLDALRVRAMDFVGDRLQDDGGDEAADIYRAFVGTDDDRMTFHPDTYEFIDNMRMGG